MFLSSPPTIVPVSWVGGLSEAKVSCAAIICQLILEPLLNSATHGAMKEQQRAFDRILVGFGSVVFLLNCLSSLRKTCSF